jgi:large subunit ribosomal protein L22
MEVMARAKYIRRTPRKARLVADQVRGLRVSEALAQLEFSPKHAARDVAKAIKSAAANAEHNHNLERDELWLKQILVDEGPTIKRIRPVSRGMAHQYFHRTCHITAIVEDRPEVAPVRPARRRATPSGGASRPAPTPPSPAEGEGNETDTEGES